MIKAGELRIGNYVYSEEFNEIRIVGLIGNGNLLSYEVDKGSLDGTKGIADANPIPLTEDILLKCGWVMYKKGNSTRFYHDDSFFDIEKHGDKYPFVIEDNEGKDGNIYYVCHSDFLHDFQNAYKTLNGNELTINL